MSWKSVDVEGVKMWERSDGIRAHQYQIEAIERAESESLRSSMGRTIYDRNVGYEEEHEDIEPIDWPGAVIILGFCLYLVYRVIIG